MIKDLQKKKNFRKYKTFSEDLKVKQKWVFSLLFLTIETLISMNFHYGSLNKNFNHLNYIYVLGNRFNILLWNLNYTIYNLRMSLFFLISLISNKGKILFVDNKNYNDNYTNLIIPNMFSKLKQYWHTNKWIGGILSNFKYFYPALFAKKSQHFDLIGKNFFGLIGINRLPDLVCFLSLENNITAFKESIQLGIPTMSLVNMEYKIFNLSFPIFSSTISLKTFEFFLRLIKIAILFANLKRINSINLQKFRLILIKRSYQKRKNIFLYDFRFILLKNKLLFFFNQNKFIFEYLFNMSLFSFESWEKFKKIFFFSLEKNEALKIKNFSEFWFIFSKIVFIKFESYSMILFFFNEFFVKLFNFLSFFFKDTKNSFVYQLFSMRLLDFFYENLSHYKFFLKTHFFNNKNVFFVLKKNFSLNFLKIFYFKINKFNFNFFKYFFVLNKIKRILKFINKKRKVFKINFLQKFKKFKNFSVILKKTILFKFVKKLFLKKHIKIFKFFRKNFFKFRLFRKRSRFSIFNFFFNKKKIKRLQKRKKKKKLFFFSKKNNVNSKFKNFPKKLLYKQFSFFKRSKKEIFGYNLLKSKYLKLKVIKQLHLNFNKLIITLPYKKREVFRSIYFKLIFKFFSKAILSSSELNFLTKFSDFVKKNLYNLYRYLFNFHTIGLLFRQKKTSLNNKKLINSKKNNLIRKRFILKKNIYIFPKIFLFFKKIKNDKKA